MVSKTSSWVPQAAVNQQFLCKTTKAHTTKKKVQKPEQGNEKRAITQAGKKTKKKIKMKKSQNAHLKSPKQVNMIDRLLD